MARRYPPPSSHLTAYPGPEICHSQATVLHLTPPRATSKSPVAAGLLLGRPAFRRRGRRPPHSHKNRSRNKSLLPAPPWLLGALPRVAAVYGARRRRPACRRRVLTGYADRTRSAPQEESHEVREDSHHTFCMSASRPTRAGAQPPSPKPQASSLFLVRIPKSEIAGYGQVVPITATNGSMSANVTVPLPLQSAFSHGQLGWFTFHADSPLNASTNGSMSANVTRPSQFMSPAQSPGE